MKKILALAALIIGFSAGATYLQDPVAISHGGTGSTSASAARTALGVLPLSGGSLSGALTSGSTISASGAISSLNGITAQLFTGTGLTGSRALVSSPSLGINSSTTTDTELNQLSGVTANVQTQMNARLPLAGGTLSGNLNILGASGNMLGLDSSVVQSNSLVYRTAGSLRWVLGMDGVAESGSDAGSNFQLRARTDAGGVIDNPFTIVRAAGGEFVLNRPFRNPVSGINANTAVFMNASNTLTSSATTSTELGYLSGTTAAVQTQLNTKLARTGDSMSGPLLMADGSASAPSVSFSGASDTGVYRTGLGNVGVSVSNATQFIVGVTAVTSSQPLIGAKGLAVTRTNIASAATLASADCSTGFINLTGTTATTLAGIATPTNGGATVGMFCYVVNLTGQNMTIAHQSGSAGAAAERIITNTGADIVSTGNSMAVLIYSQFEPRWILMSYDL